MKKALLLLAMSFCSFASWSAITALRIHTAYGTVIDLPIDQKPIIEVNDDRTVTIISSDDPEAEIEPIVLSFDDIDRCDYVDPERDDVADIIANSPITVALDASSVRFDNIPAGDSVEIFNLAGQLLLTGRPIDGSYTFRRSAVTPGVYIARIGKFNCKISL